MRRKKLYIDTHLENVEDLNVLIEKIKEKGHFTINDYYRLCRLANESKQKGRLLRRLQLQIKPLIDYVPPTKQIQKSKNDFEKPKNNFEKPKETDPIFSVSHKAKEFTFTKGKIQINNYTLKSPIIDKLDLDWLDSLDKDFFIAPTPHKKNFFHFVDSKDLCIFQNEIKKEKQKINLQRQWEEIKIVWNYKFQNYLKCSILGIENIHCHGILAPIYDLIKILDLQKYLNRTMEIPYNPAFLDIPLEDIVINDGEIIVKWNNTKLLEKKDTEIPKHYNFYKYITWRDFKRYFTSNNKYKIPKELYEDFEILFNSEIDKLLESIRKNEKSCFQTYISKNSFKQLINSYDCFAFSVNEQMQPEWSIFNYIDYRTAIFQIATKPYEFSEETLRTIDEYKKQNKMLLDKNPEDLRGNNAIINWCLGSRRRPMQLLKIIDFVFLSKIKKPYFNIGEKDIVTAFVENTSHFSDDWYTNTSHFTYMIWSKQSSTCTDINIYPSNSKYANYRFGVCTNNHTIEEAVYVICAYFTSYINNKRQGFTIPNFFKDFGIYSFSRF